MGSSFGPKFHFALSTNQRRSLEQGPNLSSDIKPSATAIIITFALLLSHFLLLTRFIYILSPSVPRLLSQSSSTALDLPSCACISHITSVLVAVNTTQPPAPRAQPGAVSPSSPEANAHVPVARSSEYIDLIERYGVRSTVGDFGVGSARIHDRGKLAGQRHVKRRPLVSRLAHTNLNLSILILFPRNRLPPVHESNSAKMPSANKRNGDADERAPLLNGDSGPSASSTGLSHMTDTNSSTTMQFFFSSKQTPGRHSENMVVRSLAYTWHITKVVLLSSMQDYTFLRSR